MKLTVKKGTTSKLLQAFIQDSSSTTGAGLTGLAWNTAGLTAYYYREGAASATAIVLATMTLGTWATGGFTVVDGTNMPGLYQLGIPDAALATGANSVVIYLKGATNMVQTLAEIELVDYDPNDAVALGLSRLDAAVSSRMATFTLPTNFSALAITAAGAVTVGTNNDKTGYSISGTKTTLDALNDITAAAVWSVAVPGAFGAGTAGNVLGNNLNASVSSRMATFSLPTNFASLAITVGGAVTVGTNSDKTGYSISGTKTTLDALNDITAASVWSVAVPGAYAAGTGGYILGTNLDAKVSTRSIAGDAMALTTAERNSVSDALLDRADAIETGATPRGILRLMGAALAGLVSGAGTGTEVFKNAVAGAKPRITATVDANGNRTAITYDQT